jgi:hypothetical protein
VRNDELLASAEAPDQSLSSISREQIANFMTAAAATGAVISIRGTPQGTDNHQFRRPN